MFIILCGNGQLEKFNYNIPLTNSGPHGTKRRVVVTRLTPRDKFKHLGRNYYRFTILILSIKMSIYYKNNKQEPFNLVFVFLILVLMTKHSAFLQESYHVQKSCEGKITTNLP